MSLGCKIWSLSLKFQAMAIKTPVIVRKNTGNLSIVQDVENGMLFENARVNFYFASSFMLIVNLLSIFNP
jgi:Glycosyl transferases group 1.